WSLADPGGAAGRAADEVPILVGQRDREAVDLRLGHVGDLARLDVEALQEGADPSLPRLELLGAAGIAEREHRLEVLVLLEALDRLAADPLRRRVRRPQLRML